MITFAELLTEVDKIENALLGAGVPPRAVRNAIPVNPSSGMAQVVAERDRLFALAQSFDVPISVTDILDGTVRETGRRPAPANAPVAAPAAAPVPTQPPTKGDAAKPKPVEDPLGAVRAELEACADPVRKAELARKARELRGHGDIIAAMAPAPPASPLASVTAAAVQAATPPQANSQGDEGPFGQRCAVVLTKAEPAKVDGPSRFSQERADQKAEVARLRRDLDQTTDPRERATIARRIRDLR